MPGPPENFSQYGFTTLSADPATLLSDSLGGLAYYTSLDGLSVLSVSNRDYYVDDCESHNTIDRPVYAMERHISVIRKGPTMPPQLEMHPYEETRADLSLSYGGLSDDAVINATFLGSRMHQSSNWAAFDALGDPMPPQAPNFFNPGLYWGDPNGDYNMHGTAFDSQDISMFYKPNKELVSPGDIVKVPVFVQRTEEDWKVGDHILIEHEYTDGFGSLRKATARLQIEVLEADGFTIDSFGKIHGWGYYPTSNSSLGSGSFQAETHVEAKLVSITGNFPQDAITDEDLYTVKLVQKPAIFEIKFPKFSYRYKYVDGEHSVFAPWSEIAFIPGKFDFLPKKGYNLGMQNRLRTLNIKNWVPKDIPKDVIQVDILYKESNSPNVYTVSSHKKDDPVEGSGPQNLGFNYWESSGNGGHNGFYTITSELIHKVVKSNQMLRPWDNVPRKALAQEVTANRLIFANYVQNYDLVDDGSGQEIKAQFLTSLSSQDYSSGSGNPLPGYAAKSLKSMRTYQLGVVYRDKYGRETPVLTSESGSIKIAKDKAKLQNRLSVKLSNSPPSWAESYTFYIKETSNEYYNLSMDRWYDAEDGGIWLSFPSSERNKITERTNLILKKQHDTNTFTDFDTTYKVLSLKNDAPTFVKTENRYWGSLPMMLPPPGWGQLGSWDSGMFYNTGVPLPNRMYLDIFAEYWDQSSFNELTSMSGAQLRVVQSQGAASSYNAMTSDTTNKTRWYDISSISYIGSPAQTQEVTTTDSAGVETTSMVELPGQQEQLVRISLEKAFGNDALFCEPKDGLSLSRGLSIECRTKIVRDKSQFEGRFFVKILRDDNVEQNIIQPQLDTEDKYQVLFSRNLKYICAAHPGTQDWSKKIIDRDGSYIDEANFIPVGITQKDNDNFKWGQGGALEGLNSGVNHHLYHIDDYSHTAPKLVSSLSWTHANKGASFVSATGGILEGPDGTNLSGVMWPIGPGDATIGAFDCRGWNNPNLPHFWFLKKAEPQTINKLIWPHYRTANHVYTDGGIPDGVSIPVVTNGNVNLQSFATTGEFDLQGNPRSWPSFGPEKYSPYSIYGTGTDYATTAFGPYENRIKENIQGSHAIMTISGSPAVAGTLSNGYDPHPSIVDSYEDNNYLQGANPTQLPAIWGNQDSFFRGSCIGCNADGSDYTGTHEYNAETFAKLREDWWYLWHGRDKVHSSWPLGRHSPERWIIDKAGAAQGYSGNGIWGDESTGVGYMDISFWGVGRPDTTGLQSRKHATFGDTLAEFNDNEFGFAQALRTVGTQFRFTHDPDKIVYTITQSEEKDIYNYEAPQGIWALWDDVASEYVGGAGIGFGSPSPSWGAKNGALSGGRAYISDLFSKEHEMIGSHPSNKRIRWTLTLDKIIGAEGEHNFHPLTNHVEPAEDLLGNAVYKSNIEIGRAKYHTNMIHVASEKGGTPVGVEYYNLASYWNTTENNGGSWTDITTTGGGDASALDENDVNIGADVTQPDTINLNDDDNFYTRNPLAYIGLHERGLNQTQIEIVTPYRGEDRDRPMSNNPAIWETEPLEDVGLDIYYAASPSYPVNLERYRTDSLLSQTHELQGVNYDNKRYYGDRGEEVIRVGSQVKVIQTGYDGVTQVPIVCAVQANTIWLTKTDLGTGSAFEGTDPNDGGATVYELAPGDKIKIIWRGEGTFYGVGDDKEWITFTIAEALSKTCYKLEPQIHSNEIGLGYFNCWSYNNGVETNRVRDDYNAVTVDKGVKASMPLATPYEEERRANGLIFSGLYNSTSGINETNQFIQAEPITKDLNPINGSIQKLFARDTDLVTFCENKVFKILAKKDALFNANGDTNVTSNNAVLGQSIPFSGEYGISKNPESFASESYRIYFADKFRGSVLRLSRDGLTPISDVGMKDWFRDNLKRGKTLLGSYDARDKQYNLTIDTRDQEGNDKAYTVSYSESKRGWVSFKSFITKGGISHQNKYYTFPSNKWARQANIDPWGKSYQTQSLGIGEMWQHSLDQVLTRNPLSNVIDSTTISVDNTISTGKIVEGMYVEGNGIPIDTIVSAVDCITDPTKCDLTLSHADPSFSGTFDFTWLTNLGPLKFTTARNHFYNPIDPSYSMVKVLFNGDKGTVKRFKTLDYEGSQAYTSFDDVNTYSLWENENETVVGNIYRDNYLKLGWYVDNIKTDLQEGKINEFINKENKWFNKIIQPEDAGTQDNLDTGEFSLQGLGYPTS